MAKLKLIETIQTKLSTLTKKDGQLIVIRDNASLYVDLDGSRIYISDWIDISTDEERLAMLSPLSNKYYYVVETNKIWRYISGSWVLVTSVNDLNEHIEDTDIHITSTERTNWDSAYTHSQSAHAPSIAEKNVIVGIQKNGADLTVDSSTRKVNIIVPTKTSELTNDSGFKLQSEWTSSDTVEMPNGKTLTENTVELTQAEYDALDDSKLTDGVNYFITDGEGGGGSIDVTTILDTKEEIEANTEENKIAGALAVKEVIEELNSNALKNEIVSFGDNVTIAKSNNSITYSIKNFISGNVEILQVTPYTNMGSGFQHIRANVYKASDGFGVIFSNTSSTVDITVNLHATVLYREL